jgi:hypothetical protein
MTLLVGKALDYHREMAMPRYNNERKRYADERCKRVMAE